MRSSLHLLEYQIALLELQALRIDPDSIPIPGHLRRSGWAPAYVEDERKRRKRKKEWLKRRIEYLQRQHYIELVKENEEQFYRLTAKGKYEVLRLQFISHLWVQRSKRWDGNYYLIIFDIPEMKRIYRDFFRALLKSNGFIQLQRSVWMSRYNPHPAIEPLLKYLGLENYFEIMEIHCSKCSKRVAKKIRA